MGFCIIILILIIIIIIIMTIIIIIITIDLTIAGISALALGPSSAPPPPRDHCCARRHCGARGMAGNVDQMRRADLMKYAASLGVATRREGRLNWRRVDEVRADCEVKLAQRASTLDGLMVWWADELMADGRMG